MARISVMIPVMALKQMTAKRSYCSRPVAKATAITKFKGIKQGEDVALDDLPGAIAGIR